MCECQISRATGIANLVPSLHHPIIGYLFWLTSTQLENLYPSLRIASLVHHTTFIPKPYLLASKIDDSRKGNKRDGNNNIGSTSNNSSHNSRNDYYSHCHPHCRSHCYYSYHLLSLKSLYEWECIINLLPVVFLLLFLVLIIKPFLVLIIWSSLLWILSSSPGLSSPSSLLTCVYHFRNCAYIYIYLSIYIYLYTRIIRIIAVYKQCCSPPMYDNSGKIKLRFQGRSTAWLRSPPENSSVCCTAFANLSQSLGGFPSRAYHGCVMGKGCFTMGFNHQLWGYNWVLYDGYHKTRHWCCIKGVVICSNMIYRPIGNGQSRKWAPTWNRWAQGAEIGAAKGMDCLDSVVKKSWNAMKNWENCHGCWGFNHQKLALAIKEIQTRDLEARMTNEKVRCSRWILRKMLVWAAPSTLWISDL